MNLVLLTEEIVKMLVSNKDVVVVKEYETAEDNLKQIEVLVAKEDFGRVIGKNGKTIHSIRNVIQASATLNLDCQVKINVDSY